jgi:NAD(P)-dependent dehydrogenase (short-subunit alcohol dehydrogenase family)
MLLAGRTAIVSGVGPGLGRTIALALAAEGAALGIGARSEDYLDTLAAELRAAGGKVLAQRTDITSAADCHDLARAVHEEFGRIDVLVNNGHQSQPREPFDEADLQSWRDAMDVNYWGSLTMTQAVVPYMKQLDDGRIIMINTVGMARIRPSDGPYVGSKSALAAATKYLAIDLGPFGIRVNGVHPGFMLEEKLDRYFEQVAADRGITPDQARGEVAAASRLGYIPSTDEVAGTVVFLASPLSRPVTGQCIHVNAGMFIA